MLRLTWRRRRQAGRSGKAGSILDEVGKGDGEQDDGVLLNQLNDLRDLINKAITSGLDSTRRD